MHSTRFSILKGVLTSRFKLSESNLFLILPDEQKSWKQIDKKINHMVKLESWNIKV